MDVLSSRILFFLGCSLSEDRTLKLLEKIVFSERRIHYAILEAPSDTLDDDFYDKKKELSNMGIKVIWYPKGHHEYISLILEEIKSKIFHQINEMKVHVITNTSVQRPAKNFICPESKMEAIQKSFSQGNNLILLNGMGGIGKTQFSSYMYYHYLDSSNGEITYLA